MFLLSTSQVKSIVREIQIDLVPTELCLNFLMICHSIEHAWALQSRAERTSTTHGIIYFQACSWKKKWRGHASLRQKHIGWKGDQS